jgi:uncharacterized SAM-binding protein YcdF (DUF218 family)
MKTFLPYLLDPMFIMGFFLWCTLWVIAQKKLGKDLFTGVFLLTLFYWLCATPLGANFLLQQLEVQEQLCESHPTAPIVVLGGGVEGAATSEEEILRLKLPTLRRVIAAHQYIGTKTNPKNPKIIIFSGGFSAGSQNIIKEADLMHTFFQQLNTQNHTVLIENRSQNTYESAKEITALLASPTEPICVITSAWHMRRTLSVFMAAGLNPLPFSVDSRYLNVPWYAVIPQFTPMEKSMLVIHEALGLLFYTLRT